jgi:3-dehydroquinate dehydratase/shikimate dehydrogenase
MGAMICLALTAGDHAENRKALLHYRSWIRIAELRLDRLRPEHHKGAADFMNRMAEETGIGFILTIRTIEDGGVWPYGEDERRTLMLETLMAVEPGTVAYVDLEMDRGWPEVEEAATRAGARIIRSLHNFTAPPADLAARLPGQYRKAGDVVKAAVMVRGTADLVCLVETAAQLRVSGRPFILIGMGPYGIATRVLAGRLGSLLTFASSSLQGHVAAAPGHMDPELLAEGFGYYDIGEATKVFGIIGNPVLHSRSPAFHNKAFRDSGADAVYLPFQVDDLPAFFRLADLLPVSGCSVTIPHKEGVVPYLTNMDVSVRQIGACNTILHREDGWFGTNTDAPGFLEPLKSLIGKDLPRKAVVVGAGGAARAIIQPLLANGVRLLLLNRSLERAQALKADFEAFYPGAIQVLSIPEAAQPGSGGADPAAAERLAAEIAPWADLVVQTTSAGMEGKQEKLDPLWFYPFSGRETVCDIVYTPAKTVFLGRAEAAGCRVQNGWPMFEQQAKLQSSLFRFS